MAGRFEMFPIGHLLTMVRIMMIKISDSFLRGFFPRHGGKYFLGGNGGEKNDLQTPLQFEPACAI